MDLTALSGLLEEALSLVLLLSAPALAAGLAAGVSVGLLGAAARVQDPTVSFVPRLLAVGAVLGVSGAWMGEHMLRFTSELWKHIPELTL